MPNAAGFYCVSAPVVVFAVYAETLDFDVGVFRLNPQRHVINNHGDTDFGYRFAGRDVVVVVLAMPNGDVRVSFKVYAIDSEITCYTYTA
jgi:hypothetical protein